MFVGHYAAALALKKYEKKASLGVLFLAVQFVDILFFPLVLMGIERMNIIENYTQSTHFELEYMPFTHSLLATFIWAALAYVIFRRVFDSTRSVAVVIALAVFSHWVFDLFVHTPDLPLWSDTSVKFGFGLWNSAIATYLLEAALLLLALKMYLGATSAKATVGNIGKFGMIFFVAFMLIANVVNIFGPLMGESLIGIAIPGLLAYFSFAAIAMWLDGKRA